MTTDAAGGGTLEHTVGGFDGEARAWVLGVACLGGAGLGALVPVLTGWASRLPWMPFQGPLELIGSFDDPWLVWGRPAIGLAVGAVAALALIWSTPVLTVRPDRVEVRRRGEVERVVDRATIASVHPRGSHLVIETETGRTLFDAEVEGDRAAIRAAFLAHGYPWEGPRD